MSYIENNWPKIREKGKWHFIIKYGAIYWGVGFAVVMSIITPWVEGLIKNEMFVLDKSQLLAHLIVSPLVGLLFGFGLWKNYEKEYLEEKLSGWNE